MTVGQEKCGWEGKDLITTCYMHLCVPTSTEPGWAVQPDPEEHGGFSDGSGSCGHPGLCSPGSLHEWNGLPGKPEETLPWESHLCEFWSYQPQKS